MSKIKKTYISESPLELKRIASRFSRTLAGGEIIALNGDLGSGKTTFVQGLFRELGIKKNITSPTFILAKEYELNSAKNPKIKHLIHIDCYRFKSYYDADSIGMKDLLNLPDTILVIEWADKIKNILPKKTIHIDFKHIEENKRQIIFKD